ncbi:ThiF family adenylyltransferase [Bacillus sp. FSL W7-1360]
MTTAERYSRQLLFPGIGEEGQRRLKNSRVLIVGMGALGTVLANHVVRAGIGYTHFVDRDYVELSNLQRQSLFNEDDVSRALPKAVAAKNTLEKVNTEVEIDATVCDVHSGNVASFTEDVDIVLDGTDNFHTRFLLNDACFKQQIPLSYGGVVQAKGVSALFVPGMTPCLRCFIGEGAQQGETCDTVGVIAPIVDIIASYQVVEVVKYLVGATEQLRNTVQTIDIWHNTFSQLSFRAPKVDCATCQKAEYPALAERATDTVALCGRETIQVGGKPLNIAAMATRLRAVATIQETPFLVRATLPEGERLVLFPDGRVLVQGTEDVAKAKSLYNKYIGH